jgi:hypothetical protein
VVIPVGVPVVIKELFPDPALAKNPDPLGLSIVKI